MAIDFCMFLSLFVFLAVTTCCCLPLSTRVGEENEAMSNMAEDLQLEVKSNIYAADWSSLEQMAQFFKVEYEGKSKLLVAKRVAERLEEKIGKLKEAEVVPYLEDVKKILTEKPSPGIKNEDANVLLKHICIDVNRIQRPTPQVIFHASSLPKKYQTKPSIECHFIDLLYSMEQKKSYVVAQKSYVRTGRVKCLSLVYKWC